MTLFLIYLGLGGVVVALANLFGDHKKIYAASILFGAVIYTNLVIMNVGAPKSTASGVVAFMVAYDLAATAFFLGCAAARNRLETSRWPGVLATFHTVMVLVHAETIVSDRHIYAPERVWPLNALYVTSLVTLLLASWPKSREEAWFVLRLKTRLLLMNFFGNFAVLISLVRPARMSRRKLSESEVRTSKLIGRMLRAARTDKGLTQTQAAAMIGISQGQVQKFESGQNAISAAFLYTVAKAYGMDLGRVFDELSSPTSDVAETRLKLQDR